MGKDSIFFKNRANKETKGSKTRSLLRIVIVGVLSGVIKEAEVAGDKVPVVSIDTDR